MRFLKILFLLLLPMLIVGLLTWYFLILRFEGETSHDQADKIIKIASGSSPDQIVDLLAERGIVTDPVFLKLYIKVTKAGPKIKAGDYLFQTPISPKQILAQLETGGIVPGKFTIIEGWNRWDIASHIALNSRLNPNSDPAAQNNALRLMNDTTLIKDLSTTATSLEGFMFPDTYSLYSDTSKEDLIKASVARFHTIWNMHLRDECLGRKQLPLELVTIASLIETEAKLPEERPIVASVIYNRLKKGMSLSLDCTIVYASKLAGKWKNDGKVYLSDVNRESPYNTRKVKGLPPGPVGSPGLASLQAALRPASTNYIYYVRDPSRNDGAHSFFADEAGFEKGVQKLRAWEQKRDAQLLKGAKAQLRSQSSTLSRAGSTGNSKHNSGGKPKAAGRK